ncbi:hypothetical protein BDV93DRAFT_564577 [Ceratobasidium sp. AG-I]|nr:hypothetical protein BDV93DRAFT_564577 [Ceratobasidium sp. AG-I]
MSREKSISPESDTSELLDSVWENSRGAKSDAARVREMFKRVATGGLEEASHHALLSSNHLMSSRPTKRARKNPATQPTTIYNRIDAARESLEQNGLTVVEFVRVMCAFDYGVQRAKEEDGFQLSVAEAEDARDVRYWAKEIARQELLREGKRMETQHILNTNADSCTVDSLKDWSPNVVYKHLCDNMPYFVSLLESFIKDGKYSSETKQDEVPTTVSVVGSILWIKRSHRANLFAKGFTIYLYGSGVHAATINVLNRLGLGVSYSTLLESLSSLNRSCTERFREVVSHCRSMFCWDNVNFDNQPAEQRIKNSGSFESGTAATIVELHPPPGYGTEAIDEALDLEKYLSAVEKAPDLAISDIIPTEEDVRNLRNEFTFETINVLTEHAGELFKQFKDSNRRFRPLIRPLLPLRITKAYPLPTLHIEQASANGNATVVEELRRITQIDKSELFKNRICIATGDLLTITRLLSVRDVQTLYMRTPVHSKDKFENLSYLVPFCGLFHTRIAAVTGIFQTHFGKPNARPVDGPASLWRHNEVLKRKNIPVSQAFKYRTVQDLAFHSLYARLLDIVQIESGYESLQEFGESLAELSNDDAWKRLNYVVSTATTRFTTPEEAGTDDVLRNSILFIRDALLFRCFVTSIKSGNMAMVELILKFWTISFRGSGRSQYAAELLRLRHNLVHAWPKSLCDLILSNMLVNMTGKENGWKETDLLQEHMNYWIKVVYKARGSNATWKWLGEISTCISALRELATQVNTSLAPRNSNQHSAPNLRADLDALIRSLVDSKVHKCDPTRLLEKPLRAKDALALGLQSLEVYNSPIKKFNRNRFGINSHVTLPFNDDGDGADGEGEDDNAEDQEPQTQDLFDVVVDNGDGEDADPFDFD